MTLLKKILEELSNTKETLSNITLFVDQFFKIFRILKNIELKDGKVLSDGDALILALNFSSCVISIHENVKHLKKIIENEIDKIKSKLDMNSQESFRLDVSTRLLIRKLDQSDIESNFILNNSHFIYSNVMISKIFNISIRSSIPITLLGNSGVGKTYIFDRLIQYYDNKELKLQKFCCHKGITYEKIKADLIKNFEKSESNIYQPIDSKKFVFLLDDVNMCSKETEEKLRFLMEYKSWMNFQTIQECRIENLVWLVAAQEINSESSLRSAYKSTIFRMESDEIIQSIYIEKFTESKNQNSLENYLKDWINLWNESKLSELGIIKIQNLLSALSSVKFSATKCIDFLYHSIFENLSPKYLDLFKALKAPIYSKILKDEDFIKDLNIIIKNSPSRNTFLELCLSKNIKTGLLLLESNWNQSMGMILVSNSETPKKECLKLLGTFKNFTFIEINYCDIKHEEASAQYMRAIIKRLILNDEYVLLYAPSFLNQSFLLDRFNMIMRSNFSHDEEILQIISTSELKDSSELHTRLKERLRIFFSMDSSELESKRGLINQNYCFIEIFISMDDWKEYTTVVLSSYSIYKDKIKIQKISALAVEFIYAISSKLEFQSAEVKVFIRGFLEQIKKLFDENQKMIKSNEKLLKMIQDLSNSLKKRSITKESSIFDDFGEDENTEEEINVDEEYNSKIAAIASNLENDIKILSSSSSFIWLKAIMNEIKKFLESIDLKSEIISLILELNQKFPLEKQEVILEWMKMIEENLNQNINLLTHTPKSILIIDDIKNLKGFFEENRIKYRIIDTGLSTWLLDMIESLRNGEFIFIRNQDNYIPIEVKEILRNDLLQGESKTYIKMLDLTLEYNPKSKICIVTESLRKIPQDTVKRCNIIRLEPELNNHSKDKTQKEIIKDIKMKIFIKLSKSKSIELDEEIKSLINKFVDLINTISEP